MPNLDAAELAERYDLPVAAAWVLGHARACGVPELPAGLAGKVAGECSEAELAEVVLLGARAGLKLYPFKRGTQTLPRVQRVVGFLRGVSFDTLLDVGTGRGVFLIPFLHEFGQVRVTSLDLLPKRIAFLAELAEGGFPQLAPLEANICDRPFADNSFDVVTCLEVLEHIPQVQEAVTAAVRMARRYVVVSVPSKPDNNPEHIHLLTKDRLTELFGNAGATRLHFSGVEGHLILVAAVGEEQL